MFLGEGGGGKVGGIGGYLNKCTHTLTHVHTHARTHTHTHTYTHTHTHITYLRGGSIGFLCNAEAEAVADAVLIWARISLGKWVAEALESRGGER